MLDNINTIENNLSEKDSKVANPKSEFELSLNLHNEMLDEQKRNALKKEKRFKKRCHYYREVFDFLQPLFTVSVCIVALFTFFFSVNIVKGTSMCDTLQGNDILLVNRLFYTPERGDIVVAYAANLPNESTDTMGEAIVKRVIGVGGDVIDITDKGIVTVNGTELEEDYILENILWTRRGNVSLPFTVPENKVFVLGDNRNYSTDSRWVDDGKSSYYVGALDIENVIGKVVFRLYPIDTFGSLY